MENYYEILGVQEDADVHSIAQAYEGKLQVCTDEIEKTELMEMYAILVDPVLRAQYDEKLEDSRRASNFPIVVGREMEPNALSVDSNWIYCMECNAKNPVQASVCQNCGAQISIDCPKCGYKLAMNQATCPRCHTLVSEYHQKSYAGAKFVENRVVEERRASEDRINALEQDHSIRRMFGVFFWLVVFVLLVGACYGLYVLSENLIV